VSTFRPGSRPCAQSHEATGTASELARRARVGFSTAYRELKAMDSFGLVVVRGEGGHEVYAAATDHADAELLRRLVASEPSSAAPRDDQSEAVRRRARALGAPLSVRSEPVRDAEREQVVVDAVRLARRDATFARVMPVMLWHQRDKLDRARLEAAALQAHEKHALGFLMALTADLAGDRRLRAWSEKLHNHRASATTPKTPTSRAGYHSGRLR
jgi:hypothetical protein